MNIPILCMACGRRSVRPFGQVTASLRCPCGSTDFDFDDPEAIAASASVQHTATEALTTSSSAFSESWAGQHWSIIQEQREGMCLWTVQTGGRPKSGGNYDVGLVEAVAQVRAELDARGLPGDPEQILPSSARSSKLAISREWAQDPVYGFNYIYLPDDYCTGRVDPLGNGRWQWTIESFGGYGSGKIQAEGEAESFREAQQAVEDWAGQNAIDIAAMRRTAAPSASEGLGQPVTGDCPRCGSGTYRGDLGYCPQCQLGGPGDPSAKKDSFASKTASVPASQVSGNRMLPIARWETPDGTEYVDIYNNAWHGDYVWQAGWTKDNYDRYAETRSGSYPHSVVSFPEFVQVMARQVHFNKLVLKFNNTGYDLEGILNGPLLPRLAPSQGGRTANANWDNSDPHDPYASIRNYAYTGPIENRPIDGEATGIRCTAPGCSWSTSRREAHERWAGKQGGEPMVNSWVEHAIEAMNEKYPKVSARTASRSVKEIDLGDRFYGSILSPELVLPGEQPYIWKLWGSAGNMGGVDLDGGRADSIEEAESKIRAARRSYGSDATPSSAQQAMWDRNDPGKKAAKIEEVAMGVLSTNPGMPKTRAVAIARRTVERFPGMVQ